MRGFTIPELLVSIFIIVLMTAIAVPSWRTGETTLALDRAAHKLAQDLRKATELAQRAQFFQCATGSISGYGMYFSSSTSTSYILYAECNGDLDYDAGSSGDTIVQTMSLESRIHIESTAPSPFFSVLFVPPVPSVYLKPGDPSQVQIVLSVMDDPLRFKTITVTPKGVIDID